MAYEGSRFRCLSTLECVFHLLRQYQLRTGGQYNGQYDALMFYYAHFYRSIQLYYLGRPDRSFMHKTNYIHYTRAAAHAAYLKRLGGGEGGGGGQDGGEEDAPQGEEIASHVAKLRTTFMTASPAPRDLKTVHLSVDRSSVVSALISFTAPCSGPSRVKAVQVQYRGNGQRQQPPLMREEGGGGGWVAVPEQECNSRHTVCGTELEYQAVEEKEAGREEKGGAGENQEERESAGGDARERRAGEEEGRGRAEGEKGEKGEGEGEEGEEGVEVGAHVRKVSAHAKDQTIRVRVKINSLSWSPWSEALQLDVDSLPSAPAATTQAKKGNMTTVTNWYKK